MKSTLLRLGCFLPLLPPLERGGKKRRGACVRERDEDEGQEEGEPGWNPEKSEFPRKIDSF